MKKLLKLFFIISIVIVGIFIYKTTDAQQKILDFFSYSKCETPTEYKIGKIDSKFNMTRSEILSDLQKAANIWNDSYGKTLFQYSNTAVLTVNFTYDERSSLYTSISELQKQLDQKNTTYEQQIAEYEASVAIFRKELADFNNTVDQYNKAGGAPPNIYNDLISQQKQLQETANALNEEANRLNLVANNYNTDVQKLNQNITEFNTELSQKPEEGLYDPNSDTITIFFITGQDELIHTLAHEFGHSLGLSHVSNPKSIMYPYTSKYLSPTSQDLEQLTAACVEEPVFLHWAEVLADKYTELMIPILNHFN